jgi:hypothetical protein
MVFNSVYKLSINPSSISPFICGTGGMGIDIGGVGGGCWNAWVKGF